MPAAATAAPGPRSTWGAGSGGSSPPSDPSTGPSQDVGDNHLVGQQDLASSAAIVATAGDGIWDLSFVPIDATRRALVAVGPAYHVGESSYLVRADSPYRQAGDLHRPSVVIMGVAGTATLRTSEQAAAGATAIGAATLPRRPPPSRPADATPWPWAVLPSMTSPPACPAPA